MYSVQLMVKTQLKAATPNMGIHENITYCSSYEYFFTRSLKEVIYCCRKLLVLHVMYHHFIFCSITISHKNIKANNVMAWIKENWKT
jgi:hypothetical protein